MSLFGYIKVLEFLHMSNCFLPIPTRYVIAKVHSRLNCWWLSIRAMSDRFINSTSWPDHVIRHFIHGANFNAVAKECRYYGPYTSLLTHCFGADYLISPQAPPTEESRKAVNFLVYAYEADQGGR